MIEMRCSKPEEIPRLKELWKLSFGDEDSYIDLFFDTQYRPRDVLVLINDNVLVSMLVGLPMKVVLPDKREYSAAYIYAFCTHPEARRCGNASNLMLYASFFFKENGKELLLVKPANPDRAAFFEQRGFSGRFPLQEAVYPGGGFMGCCDEGRLIPAEPAEYDETREYYLEEQLHVKCGEIGAAHQKANSRRSGADLYFAELDGVIGCVAAEYADKNRLVIKELLIPDDLCDAALRLVASKLPAAEYVVRRPDFSWSLLGGETEEFFLISYLFSGLNTRFEPHMPGYPGFAYD